MNHFPNNTGSSDGSDIDDDDDDQWMEVVETRDDNPLVACLFCENTSETSENAWDHIKTSHGLSLKTLVRAGLDCFAYIKLVNYARQTKPSAEQILTQLSAPSTAGHVRTFPWSNDAFLKPLNPDDPLLQFDFEGLVPESGGVQNGLGPEDAVGTSASAGGNALNQMRSRLQDLLVDAASIESTAKPVTIADDDDRDDLYYESYGHFSIHEEMLKDYVRTDAYRDAVLKNAASAFQGKIVLDVGCGTGILSMFAAKAGAKRVYAVDFSEIAFNAMDIVKENGIDNIITVKHQRVEDLVIPDKVDIVISEWMGYCLLFECMLESVIYARDHYLSPSGIVLPDKYELLLAGLGDTSLHAEHVGYWSDVYGFKMSCMRSEVIREASLTIVPEGSIITASTCVKSYDLNDRTLTSGQIEFVADWTLVAQRDGPFVGWVMYFDTKFVSGLENKVHFTTGPHGKPTHWKQTVFLLEQPLQLQKGQELTGKVSFRRDARDNRALKVGFQFRENSYKYYLR